MSGSGARGAAWAVVVGLGVLGPLLGRAAWEGRGALDEAGRAAQEGRVDHEIMQLGRAARWRVPIADHDEEALRRLMAIAGEAERSGANGSQTALSAYREARGALLASQAWGVADPGLLEAANAGIARLMAAQEQMFGTDLSGTGTPEAYHLALLQRAGEQRPPWGVVSAVVTALALGLALRGGRSQGAARVGWGAVAVLGTVVTWALRP